MALASEVAVIIPTTFTRTNLLKKTLDSLELLRLGKILIIIPKNLDSKLVTQLLETSFNHELISRISIIHQSGTGIANAINTGFQNITGNISIASWIGDDDYIMPSSIEIGVNFLKQNPSYVAIFGKCIYINEKDELLWENSFGRISGFLAKFGPNLIPQPGSFFRLSSLHDVNLLTERFLNSFDHDLYLKLMKIGKIKFFNDHFGSFRWHPDSVSVNKRYNLCLESALIRVRHRKTFISKFLQILLEPFNFFIVYYAPYFVIRSKKTP